MNYAYLSLFLLILTGCNRLSVRTDYFTNENLASYHVQTPDPLLDVPLISQRLVITWCLPKATFKNEQVYLQLKVRFGNLKEEITSIALTEKSGTYVYTLPLKKYQAVGGISTYKVEIYEKECLIEKWVHPLWEELITFPTIPD